MAVATRKKSVKKTRIEKTPKTSPVTVLRRTAAQEAPDRGFENREAPEGRLREAPDAGDGRAGLIESEFTHGRSQS